MSTRADLAAAYAGCLQIRVFPGEDALLRLVSAVLVEIDEKWASETKAYIKWECQDA